MSGRRRPATRGCSAGVRWQLVAWSGGIVARRAGRARDRALRSPSPARSRRRATAQLAQRADVADPVIAQRPGRPGPGRPPVGLAFGGPSSGTFAFVVRPTASVIGPAGLDLPPGLPDAAAIDSAAPATGAVDIRTRRRRAGTPVRLLSEPVERGGIVYVVQVGQDITAEQQDADDAPHRAPRSAASSRSLAALVAGASTPAGRSSRSATRCAASASSPPTPATSCGRRWRSSGPASSISSATPTAGRRGRDGARRHHGRGRPPHRAGRRPAAARPERLGRRRARPRAASTWPMSRPTRARPLAPLAAAVAGPDQRRPGAGAADRRRRPGSASWSRSWSTTRSATARSAGRWPWPSGATAATRR